MGLAGIFDDRQIVPSRNVQDRLHVGGHAVDMDGHDRARARCDLLRDALGIEAECVRLDVHEDGDAVVVEDGGGRGPEGEGGDDHLVARLQTDAGQRHVERGRAEFVATQ